MNPLDAAYHVVHEYEGGAPVVAARLGKPVSTLNQELRPPRGCGAKLGLLTAVAISELTNDARILHSFAEQLGYRCVQVRLGAEIDDRDLLASVNAFALETSEALGAMARAIEDGKITETEVRRFEKEVADIAPKAVRLAEVMRALAARQSLERSFVRPVA